MPEEIHRYLRKGDAEKINVMVFDEVEEAIWRELRTILRKGVRVPKERGLMRPSLIDLANHVLIGWLCMSPEAREQVRAVGQSELERRQRSAEPIPFDPGGLVLDGIAGEGGGDVVTPRPIGSSGKRVGRRRKDGTRDGKAIRNDRRTD